MENENEEKNAFDEEIDPSLLVPDQTQEGDSSPLAETEKQVVGLDEGAVSSTAGDSDEWKDVPFHAHPRFQQLARERKEARARLQEVEQERARFLEERERIRDENQRLAYYKQMDEMFTQHPDRFEKARKIYELGQNPELEKASTEPMQAEVFKLKQEMKNLRDTTESARNQQVQGQRFHQEVGEINRLLEADKGLSAEDHQFVGETIHMKYRANLGRGARVPLAQVAQEVIEWRKRDRASMIESYKKQKRGTGEPGPARQGQARVPLSAEADKHRSKLKRLPSGRIDPGWADDAAREMNDLMGQSR